MIKLLILFCLFFFVIFRLGGFLLRTLFGSANQRQSRHFSQAKNPQKKKWQPKGGNLKVDYDPQNPKSKSPKGYRDGEYVDYEELN